MNILPFADKSFDVVLCRVALPYMNNRRTIAEVARILKPNGVFLLKTHAPPFYSAMLKERIKTFHPKQIAYPLICVAGSIFHHLSGRQLENGFWKGKEIFQTRRFLEKEFAKNGLEIKTELTRHESVVTFVFNCKEVISRRGAESAKKNERIR